jgi:hypothetical protein
MLFDTKRNGTIMCNELETERTAKEAVMACFAAPA